VGNGAKRILSREEEEGYFLKGPSFRGKVKKRKKKKKNLKKKVVMEGGTGNLTAKGRKNCWTAKGGGRGPLFQSIGGPAKSHEGQYKGRKRTEGKKKKKPG